MKYENLLTDFCKQLELYLQTPGYKGEIACGNFSTRFVHFLKTNSKAQLLREELDKVPVPMVLGELNTGDKFKFADEEVFLPYEVIERKGVTVFCNTPGGNRQYYNAGLAVELWNEHL